MTLTWSVSYTSNPAWLREVLLQCCAQGRNVFEHVDIYAFYRGATGWMYCLRQSQDEEHIQTSRMCRFIVLSAPCIWTRQEPLLYLEVLRGLRSIRSCLERMLVRLVVSSKMDASVKLEGTTSNIVRGNLRLDYVASMLC